VVVCESSKQIGHTKGSGSTRLALEVLPEAELLLTGSAAVDLRVFRPNPLDREAREVDVEDRMGAATCVCETGGSEGEIPAKVVTEDALSMYFSIRRSLFQFIYRSKREAVLACSTSDIDTQQRRTRAGVE
jgi:hypothetical protein